jgi:hypothetical protein
LLLTKLAEDLLDDQRRELQCFAQRLEIAEAAHVKAPQDQIHHERGRYSQPLEIFGDARLVGATDRSHLQHRRTLLFQRF